MLWEWKEPKPLPDLAASLRTSFGDKNWLVDNSPIMNNLCFKRWVADGFGWERERDQVLNVILWVTWISWPYVTLQGWFQPSKTRRGRLRMCGHWADPEPQCYIYLVVWEVFHSTRSRKASKIQGGAICYSKWGLVSDMTSWTIFTLVTHLLIFHLCKGNSTCVCLSLTGKGAENKTET